MIKEFRHFQGLAAYFLVISKVSPNRLLHNAFGGVAVWVKCEVLNLFLKPNSSQLISWL